MDWLSLLHKQYRLGGDTRQCKQSKQHVYNINDNNAADFVKVLNEIRAKDLVIKKVQGDEPTKYIDSKSSREESTQKQSYIQGLHKKQGKFSRAVDHLVCSQVKCNDDKDVNDTVTEPLCNKIDMSNIDFGNKWVEASNNNADSKQDSSSKLQDEDNNVLTSLSITSK